MTTRLRHHFATLVTTPLLLAGALLIGTALIATPAHAAPTRTPVLTSQNVTLTGADLTLTAPVRALGASKKPYASVPPEYVYDPKLGSLHDYCTNAPDSFPAPHAKNASFRGPCARHDLCIGAAPSDRSPCDDGLKADMYTNCEYWYGKYNPLRYACKTTALVYWAAVVVATRRS
jgi:hypothetical protein